MPDDPIEHIKERGLKVVGDKRALHFIEDQLVHCKLCDTPIRDLRSGATYANYREIRVYFDNQTDHIASICDGCLNIGLDNGDLELLYCRDMVQWYEDDAKSNHRISIMFWLSIAYRLPISYREHQVGT